VHVVQLPGGEAFRVRTFGTAAGTVAPELVAEVLKHTSHIQVWNLAN
jgi:hypothetical protein